MVETTKKNEGNTTANVSKSGTKVTVALKHPAGIYLQLYEMVEKDQLTAGGTFRSVKESVPVGERIRLNGTAHPFGAIPDYRIVAGYALTEGVDKEFFDKWMEQNKLSSLVKNELIFAYESAADTAAQASDGANVRSGLEPLAQSGDPRAPRRIETAERMAA